MIKLENLYKSFRKGKRRINIIENLNLKIKKGEFIVFFGPNGSGKTTLLNCIAGLENINQGKILINGKGPSKSNIGFVFQNYNDSMLPWRTVKENIELPLECKNYSKKKSRDISISLLKKIGLYNKRNSHFFELSGGQKQLTAICRALVINPDVLILDEPFSGLDYTTQRKLELELLKIWSYNKKTTLFVSHDIDEAIFLADKVMILSKDRCKVKGIVDVLLPRPRNLNLLKEQKFFAIKKTILEIFKNEK